MPIEIRELHIKINVDEGNKQQASSSPSKKKEDKKDMVAECVEQVMEILQRQKER